MKILAEYLQGTNDHIALRGLARVLLEGPDFKVNRPQRIAVSRPNKLRFEVLGLFDVLAVMLVSNGHEFGFYDASRPEILRGAVTPDLLWQWTRIDLRSDEVVELLLAAPRPSPGMEIAGIWLESDAGITVAYGFPALAPDELAPVHCEPDSGDVDRKAPAHPCSLSFEDLGRGAKFFRFDSRGLLREMRSLESGWVMRYRASFEDYFDVSDSRSGHSLGDPSETTFGRLFPRRITVDSPQVEAMARFEWKRIMLTEELPDRLFVIPEEIGFGG